MKQEQIQKLLERYHSQFIVAALFLCYAFLPTNNSSVDGLGYACEIVKGDALFKPHHLLYNVWNHLLLRLVQLVLPSVDPLWLFKFQNSVFAALSLWILALILKLLKQESRLIGAWILFVGSTFGWLRFATENETYIVPVFFSLLSSYFLMRGDYQKRWISFSALAGVMAILFHQLLLFWEIGIAVFLLIKRKTQAFLIFSMFFVLVPLAYVLVMVVVKNEELSMAGLMNFLLHDYTTGVAKTDFGLINFLMTPVSFIRTFFQVHGSMVIFLKHQLWLFIIPLVLSVGLIMFACIFLFKKRVKLLNGVDAPWGWMHVLIFVLQFLFAFYSHGNAEFMVMLPFLMAMSGAVFFEIPLKVLRFLGLSMLVWNLSFAIVPNCFLTYYGNDQVIDFIKKAPSSIFIASDKNALINEFEYQEGEEITTRIVGYPLEKYVSLIHQSIREGKHIYTDVVDRPNPMSRSSLLEKILWEDDFIVQSKVMTVTGYYGQYHIYELKLKE